MGHTNPEKWVSSAKLASLYVWVGYIEVMCIYARKFSLARKRKHLQSLGPKCESALKGK